MKREWLVAVVCLAGFAGCGRVLPGEVGIVVNNYGTQKGVQDFPLQTGRVWYNPITHDLYTFPTFMQNQTWANEEGISFGSSEGASVLVDVALSYTIDPEKVPYIFIKHRKDIDSITASYLRIKVRDAFNKAGSRFNAVEVCGEKKADFIDEVTKELKNTLEPEGFIIDTVSIVGQPKPDDRVMSSISATIEAKQKAIEAENKVKQFEAEAKQKVAEAEGQAESILLEAKARAEANELLTQSLTPELIQYKIIEQWDGVAPRVIGGNSPNFLIGVGTE